MLGDLPWFVPLLGFLTALIALMLARVPVAFALLALNILGVVLYLGFGAGLEMLALSTFSGITKFVLTPIPFFILMGEILLRTGVAFEALRVLGRLLARIRGRELAVCIFGGALFGMLSGSTMANTALFGTNVLPKMEEEGYSPRLAMGSILASGGLAMIIPPSALAVVWGATASVPIGPLLIAGLVPGMLMAVGYLIVIALWSKLSPDSIPAHAPTGATDSQPQRSLLVDVLHHLAPLSLVIILVVGFIMMGVATPTESAALGVAGAVIVVLLTGHFDTKQLAQASIRSAELTGLIFLILIGSDVYSRIMAISGATSGLVRTVLNLDIGPFVLLIAMQLVILFLGLFLEQISIMLVTLPFFMPVVVEMGWDPIWFGILMLINLQVALTTPPFGMTLFVMKGVVGDRAKLTDIYRGVVPFIASDVAVIVLIAAFPVIAVGLPQLLSGGA